MGIHTHTQQGLLSCFSDVLIHHIRLRCGTHEYMRSHLGGMCFLPVLVHDKLGQLLAARISTPL